MRLRTKDLQEVYLKKRIITKDSKGNEKVSYSDVPIEILMNVQSSRSVINAQIYGAKLSNMKSCKYQGDLINEFENELDGLCVYVDKDEKPDYKIVSIEIYSTHKNIMIERL